MKDEYETVHEQELGRLFRQMRREDAACVPDFPDATVLADRVADTSQRSVVSLIPKVAAAAAVAALGILLLREPAPQDPAILYAEVMNANSIATDTLLSVSPGTLPGMVGMPQVYEIELAAGDGRDIN